MQKQFTAKQTTVSSKGDPKTPRKTPVSGPSYKMSGAIKALLATEVDPHQRGHLKRMMIEAKAYADAQAIELSKKKDKKSAAEMN
jgi:hypothetical protein